MRREIIETGKTVEDAINAACSKLGCEREDCEWEILDLPKKSLFGLKSSPAKVKVAVGEDEVQPAPAPIQEKKELQPQPKPERKPQPERQPKPEHQPRPVATAPAPKVEERKNYPEKADAPLASPPSEEMKAKADLAGRYLLDILKQIDLPHATIDPVWDEGGVCLCIKGDGLGIIIGRRGDTLDALQYLAALVANRIDGDYLRITVDCGDYRLKRKSTLEALARKLSSQVLKTDTSKTLEPMNPFERRIIHATVSTIEGVSSASIGDEPNRRVIITSPNAKGGRRPPGGSRDRDRNSTRPPRNRAPIADRPSWPDEGAKGDRPDEHGTAPGRRSAPPRGRGDRERRGGGRGERRERTPAYQPTKEQPDTPPTEADNKPLYGKIDLE
ncbi:MAG: Jag N-terminal domain-containing protein [Oscillospiraceae bacterium]|nr:Jag N-terminal domain-containing protein [Oscillospiraceae bacterium]